MKGDTPVNSTMSVGQARKLVEQLKIEASFCRIKVKRVETLIKISLPSIHYVLLKVDRIQPSGVCDLLKHRCPAHWNVSKLVLRALKTPCRGDFVSLKGQIIKVKSMNRTNVHKAQHFVLTHPQGKGLCNKGIVEPF